QYSRPTQIGGGPLSPPPVKIPMMNRSCGTKLARSHSHRLCLIKIREKALEIFNLRQVVDGDIRLRRVIDRVVLVIGFCRIEGHELADRGDDRSLVGTG